MLEQSRHTHTQDTTMQPIGFIGASGLMGHGIAKNLRVEAQEPLTGTPIVAR